MFNSTAQATGYTGEEFAPAKPVEVEWHKTPRDVQNAFWLPAAQDAGMTVDELLDDGESVGVDAEGNEVAMTREDTEQAIIDMGLWGFADTKARKIHLWAAAGTDDLRIAELIAHEIGHLTGVPVDDDVQEEMRADQYASVAVETLRILRARSEMLKGDDV